MATKTELKRSISRLRKLAQHLTTVPAKLWDMYTFGDGRNRSECKTACCVLGHAATIPAFQKLGLKWEGRTRHGAIINYKGAAFDSAGQNFFGLNSQESNDLFLDGYAKTCGEKIDEILRLIEKREWELANA